MTRILRHRARSHRRGYAMAMFLTILLILSGVSVSAVMAMARNSASAVAVERGSSARAVTHQALERFYAALLATGTPTTLGEQHADIRTSQEASGQWWQLVDASADLCDSLKGSMGPAGCARPCPTASDASGSLEEMACYKLWWTWTGTKDAGILVTAAGRAGCLEDGPTCRYAKATQQILRQQFFDYLLFTEYNAPAPSMLAQIVTPEGVDPLPEACTDPQTTATSTQRLELGCPPAALATMDDLSSGPIYTADDFWTVCGTPLLGSAAAAGPGIEGAWSTTTGPCGPATPVTSEGSSQTVNAARLALPIVCGPAGGAGCATDPTSIVGALSLAPKAGAQTDLRFSRTGVSIDGQAPVPLPASGVIHVRGDATVANDTAEGRDPGVRGSVSVFVDGTLTLVDSITYYADGNRDAYCADTVPGQLDAFSDSLGLNAGRVVLASTGRDMCTDAIIVSLTDGVSVLPNADELSTGDTLHTWYLYGSIASRYLGVTSADETTVRNEFRRPVKYRTIRKPAQYSDTQQELAPQPTEVIVPGASPPCPDGTDESLSADGRMVCVTIKWVVPTVDVAQLVDPGPGWTFNPELGEWEQEVVIPPSDPEAGLPPGFTYQEGSDFYAKRAWGDSYAKRFIHDQRFTRQLLQPPYLLTPANGAWKRLDVVDQDVSENGSGSV